MQRELHVDREFSEVFGKKGLHFTHVNVQSLQPRIDKISLLVRKSALGVLYFTET